MRGIWFGLFAPAGTPPAAVELLNSKVNALLALPEVKEGLLKLGLRAGGRRTGRARREGAVGAAEVDDDRARKEHPHRAMTVRRGPIMAERKRQMHLGVFVLGTGNHSAGWRYEGAATSSCSLPVMQTIAQIAERGKFDLFFISDGLAMDPGDHPSFVNRFEPLDAALGAQRGDDARRPRRHRVDELRRALSTSRAPSPRSTISATAAPAGTSSPAPTTRPRSISASERSHEHDLRYEIASEFVDVVRGLWDSWDDGAIVADKATGVYLDKSKVRPLDHKGRFYSVQGPAQHRAVAAGPSGHHPGRRLAARAGAVGALGRPRVLRGQRRQGVGQGRLRQPEAARRQARPRAATSCRSCRA